MGRMLRWSLALAAGWSMACSGSPAAVEIGSLEGYWDWRSASGGIAGRTITPASEGYQLQVRFLPGGKAELYQDGNLKKATDFQLTVGKAGGSFEGRDVVLFEEPLFGGWEEMGVELTGSRLLLADGCCDGFTYDFERLQGP